MNGGTNGRKRRIVLKASIHCIEPIPCNPCETSCPAGAITVGSEITDLPVLDPALCTGCGICLAVCPGLDIRRLEEPGPAETETETGAEERGRPQELTVAFPWEYLDLPEAGGSVTLVDMNGRPLGKGTVTRVRRPLKDDPTTVIYVSAAPEAAREAWSIRHRSSKS